MGNEQVVMGMWGLGTGQWAGVRRQMSEGEVGSGDCGACMSNRFWVAS
jgi:hypothetical protein